MDDVAQGSVERISKMLLLRKAKAWLNTCQSSAINGRTYEHNATGCAEAGFCDLLRLP
jgi:hypothetical protein